MSPPRHHHNLRCPRPRPTRPSPPRPARPQCYDKAVGELRQTRAQLQDAVQAREALTEKVASRDQALLTLKAAHTKLEGGLRALKEDRDALAARLAAREQELADEVWGWAAG